MGSSYQNIDQASTDAWSGNIDQAACQIRE